MLRIFGYQNTSQKNVYKFGYICLTKTCKPDIKRRVNVRPYTILESCNNTFQHSDMIDWIHTIFGLQYLPSLRIIITLDLNVGLSQFQRHRTSTDIITYICTVQALPLGIRYTRFRHLNNKQQHNDPSRYSFLYNSWRKHQIDMLWARERCSWKGLWITWVKRP